MKFDTYREYLNNLTNEEFAKYLIQIYSDCEINNDDNTIEYSYYITTDGERFFYDYDDEDEDEKSFEKALNHQIKLLNKPFNTEMR